MSGLAKVSVMIGGVPDLKLVIEALGEPIIVVRGGRIELTNAPARKLLGQSIEGRDVRLAIRHPQALDLLLAHRSGEVDVAGIGELGRTWRLHIKNLGQLTLVRMVDRSAATSTERMRVDFVANASHELRTPLAAVIGYAETIGEGENLTEELRSSFARTIGDEAQRMLRIIEDLMSLSRLEADRFVKPTEMVRLADIIDAAVTNTRFAADERGCGLITDVGGDLPQVPGDFDQLVQVFENLISNAVRYGCGSGENNIRVSASRQGSFVRIAVSDQGPGIAREHLSRLTERFYRVDPARSRNSGGTGLGLSIVKHIVERHRGLLEIESEVGTGTTVTVQLPIPT